MSTYDVEACRRQAEVLENRNVKAINWRVGQVGNALHLYLRGASMWARRVRILGRGGYGARKRG